MQSRSIKYDLAASITESAKSASISKRCKPPSTDFRSVGHPSTKATDADDEHASPNLSCTSNRPSPTLGGKFFFGMAWWRETCWNWWQTFTNCVCSFLICKVRSIQIDPTASSLVPAKTDHFNLAQYCWVCQNAVRILPLTLLHSVPGNRIVP